MINNAGNVRDRSFLKMSDEEFDSVFAVHVRGTFLCSQAVARHMLQRGDGGRIINISSLAGQQGFARYGAYCASKFAVIGLTQVMAQELGSAGITVNAVCPGLVDTERVWGMAEGLKPEGMTTAAFHKEHIERSAAMTALGRVAQPEDVAQSVAFLASDEAAYLTGASLSVSGGARMG